MPLITVLCFQFENPRVFLFYDIKNCKPIRFVKLSKCRVRNLLVNSIEFSKFLHKHNCLDANWESGKFNQAKIMRSHFAL